MMAALRHCALPIEALGQIGEIGGVARFRGSEAIIATTAVPRLSAAIVNVCAPAGTVFGQFDCYRALAEAEHRFVQGGLHPDRIDLTDAILTELIRTAGHRKRSNFSGTMLGAWTRRAAFDLPVEQGDAYYCAHRHFSLVAPEAEQDRIVEHFHRQIARFGDASFIACSDEVLPIEFEALRGTPHWALLYENVSGMSGAERTWLYEAAQAHLEDPAALCDALDPRFGIRGLISLHGVPPKFVPFVQLERFASVLRLRLRLRVALTVCRLPALVAKEQELKTLSFGVYPEGVLDEIANRLKRHLDPYREIIDFAFRAGG